MTVQELRGILTSGDKPVPGTVLEALECDSRLAVRQLAAALRQRNLRQRRENLRLDRLHRYEKELWQLGHRNIAGVDEAGVAPLAGPVVAAAVILPHRYKLPGLNDSKKIASEEKRRQLAIKIKSDAICWAVARAEVEEIDTINIYHSSLLAMRRAVEGLGRLPDFILVDARTIPHCQLPQQGIIHGDALSASIAAASILAKTSRDEFMSEMDALYPGYGFSSHKGYPTPEHLKILKEKGPLPIHRRTFTPVREALDFHPIQQKLF